MNLLLFNLRVDRDHTALGFTTDWINELASHFDRVTVITMYRGALAVAGNVEVFSAGLERGHSKARRVATFYGLLIGVLRRRRIDVCFSHMMPLFSLLGGPLLRMARIPSALWYAHNHRPAILGPALAFADIALASTPTAFPIATPKLRIVGQGVDVDRFHPRLRQRKKGTLRFLSIGRFSRIKNISYMIESVAKVLGQVPDCNPRLILVGEPLSADDHVYVAECKRLARDLGVADLVEWDGPVSFAHVHEAYHRGDVFLSANDNGLDKAILEAMASGLGVVAMHPALACTLGSFYATQPDEFFQACIKMASLTETDRLEIGADLRSYVVAEHSLEQLGARIAAQLRGLVR